MEAASRPGAIRANLEEVDANMRRMEITKGRGNMPLLLAFAIFLLVMPAAWAVDAQAGWPKNIGGDVQSSPNLVDLDLDGDFEVLIGSEDGNVYALQGDGTAMSGWPVAVGYNVISTPGAADIDGDGDLEIVSISTQTGVNFPSTKIFALELNGDLVWSKTTGVDITSSPALGDIDNDGSIEIVAGSDDANIYVFENDGTDAAGWPKATLGKILGSAALADLDGDGNLEIIVGSEDGNLYAWHHDGTLYWNLATGPIYESSPAVADIDGDGSPEIVVGSENGLYAVNHDGTLLWSGNIESSSTPAIGDIDGDGDLEIAVGTTSFSPKNKVYLLDGDGSVIWEKRLASKGQQEYREKVGSSPAIGDIDGDGTPEVIVSAISTYTSGTIYAWDAAGTEVWSAQMGAAKFTTSGSSPAIGDIDGDGDVEVIVGSTSGMVHAWDFTASYDPDSVKWGMFRHDQSHRGTILPGNSLDIVDAKTDETTYTRESNVAISCNVLDVYGIGAATDSVTATIDRPDGGTDTVTLARDVSGEYSATYTNALWVGQYDVTISAARSGYAGASASLTFGVANPPFWHYKIPLDVGAGASARTDAPIDLAINFTKKLADQGASGTLDTDSLRVYESDAGGNDQQEVPSDFTEQVGVPGATNIALGKTATASTTLSSYVAGNAVDANSATLWAGTGSHVDWIKIDLGEMAYIYKVILAGYKDTHHLEDFTIEVGMEDTPESYTTVAEVVGNTLLTSEHEFTPTPGRYVKLTSSKNYGASRTIVREFEIYSYTGSSFEASSNAVGNLKWIMDGTTPAGTSRYYNLYFDITENGAKSDPAYGVDYSALSMPAGITITEGATDVRVEPNVAPVAAIATPADASVYTSDDTVSFDAAGSTDYDGVLVSYQWSSNLDGALSTESSFDTSGLSVGTHTITLTVTDDDGATASAQATVRINSPPTAQVVFPIDGSVYSQNDVIDFEATGIDTDGTIVSYSWTSSINGALSSSNSFSATGLGTGTHTITVTVTDNDGTTSASQVSLRINSPPTATITSPADGAIYSQEDTITFEGTGEDTDGTVASYEWSSDIDDILGTTSTLTTSSLSAGIHTITLTATDNNGGTGADSITVEQKWYGVEWLINQGDLKLGSTIPIKFTVLHPITGDFIADESVVVRVIDPDGIEVFNATYADEATRSDTDVRIDTEEFLYITNFHSERDGATGTYTFDVEFDTTRDGTTGTVATYEIHTRLSKAIDTLVEVISVVTGGGGPSPPPKKEKKAKVASAAPAAIAEVKPTILKGYDLEWLLAKKTQRPGSEVPIAFTLRSPKTKGFVIDESVTVRVYDPDGSGVYMATYSGDGVWVDTKSEVYSTKYATPKDAPTGTYTVKVEVEGEAEDYETTVDVHTRTSKAVDSVVKFFKGIFGR
jgi:hypothetical protein